MHLTTQIAIIPSKVCKATAREYQGLALTYTQVYVNKK